MRDDELEKILQRKFSDMMKRIERARSEDLYPEGPLNLTASNFDEVLRKYPYVVVDFWAEWCGPCRYMEPVIKKLAKELRGKVVFGKVNVDENPDIAVKFGVMGVPTLIFFKNGLEVDRMVGAASLRAVLERVIRAFGISI